MGHRLSRITTRTADTGMTGLATGLCVEKDSPRVVTMGAVDELNSCIGVVLAHGTPDEIRVCLLEVQQRLLESARNSARRARGASKRRTCSPSSVRSSASTLSSSRSRNSCYRAARSPRRFAMSRELSAAVLNPM
jgi:cob(I)alamin adenosyltransferase